MRQKPDVGFKIPVNILIVVDLPAPLAPIKPKICPFGTSNDKSLTASKICFSGWIKERMAPFNGSF